MAVWANSSFSKSTPVHIITLRKLTATLFLFQNLITVDFFFSLQILVCALMTANLWHKAEAQLNPTISTVLGKGNGVSFFSVPQNPQTFLNPVGGGAGAFQGAASEHDHDYAVSTVLT